MKLDVQAEHKRVFPQLDDECGWDAVGKPKRMRVILINANKDWAYALCKKEGDQVTVLFAVLISPEPFDPGFSSYNYLSKHLAKINVI